MKLKRANTRSAKEDYGSITLGSVIVRLFALMLFWAGGSWLMLSMWADGYWQFSAIILVITLVVTIIWVRPETYPLRWMSPGLAFMLLISVYPILYTIYISFTDFGTGHLLTKVQAIQILEARMFLPKDGLEYEYALYQNPAGEFALLLKPQASVTSGEPIFIVPEKTIPSSLTGTIIFDAAPPDQVALTNGQATYSLVPRNKMLTAISKLKNVTFGADQFAVQIDTMTKAGALEPQFVYDEKNDTLLDRKSNILYQADNQRGKFISADGTELDPGYTVIVGLTNYNRFFNDPSYRGPLAQVFIWTVLYALISVVLSFLLGLLIAIAFGRNMPGKGIIKSLLIIPFAIPNVISILIWRGLFSPIDGLYGNLLSTLFGRTINIFADPMLIKVALIFVEIWLSYPYFFLINSGALQAIPLDMYEAADMDGANWWHQFRYITLPLLLVSVGPLLIGSFMYNFNNFNVVYLFNKGGPPMVGTATPAGYSDILISYVYRIAFDSNGHDYGYATAITVIIFLILLGVTLFQYRYMNMVEKVGENV